MKPLAGAAENSRAFYERQREKLLNDIERKKEDITKSNTVKIGADKFVAQNDYVENELKRHTVGLVQLDDFLRIKEQLKDEKPKEKAYGVIITT